jgi:adenosylcobyric acid synthase
MNPDRNHVLMVQGTTSSAGKSLLVTGLCRLFRQCGLRVAPFKAQNMANNSFVTPQGGEIGRAQAVQAEAAGVAPHVDMNPILLKPEGNARSQVVVLGKSMGSLSAREYHEKKLDLRRVIFDCLVRLRAQYDVVVIEGAGSPAEINLRDRDLVNMHVAEVANAPVLLCGDIDRGGVFAAFVGTLELLEPHERARIAAFVVNKFRGDLSLLEPGLEFLTRKTGVPVLGVLPYLQNLRIPDEDSLALEDRRGRVRPGADAVDIVVVRFPRVSNYDDVLALEHEPSVTVRFAEDREALRGADLVILPGSKCTVDDLGWLRQTGIADEVQARAERGEPILGLCGGCQMLGQSIEDPHAVESLEPVVSGLGLLPLVTRFQRDKVTAQVQARAAHPSLLAAERDLDTRLTGYEIHMGRVTATGECRAAFEILGRNGESTRVLDGAVSDSGLVVGTLIHGILDNAPVRASLLHTLRLRKGLSAAPAPVLPERDAELDRLAAVLREHLNLGELARITGISQLTRL